MKHKLFVGVLGISLLLQIGTANAAVLFEENFQGMGGGALASGTAAQTGSFTVDNRGGYVGVVVDPAGGNGHVLSVYDYKTNVPAEIRANFSEVTTSAIRLSYDIYHDSSIFASPTFSEAGVFVEGAARTTYHYTNKIDDNTAGFNNYSTTTVGGWTHMTPLAMRTWYRIVMDLPEASQATINSVSVFGINADGSTGSLVYSGDLPTFTGSGVPAYNFLRFGQSGLAGLSNYYLDNLKVETVPEPMTLTLMGVGLAGLVVRRKRK